MIAQTLKKSLQARTYLQTFSRFSFATAKGDGISDPKNPRVFLKVAKNGTLLGEMQFEVSFKKF